WGSPTSTCHLALSGCGAPSKPRAPEAWSRLRRRLVQSTPTRRFAGAGAPLGRRLVQPIPTGRFAGRLAPLAADVGGGRAAGGQLVLHGEGGRLQLGVHLQLLEDVLHMGAGRVGAGVEG